MHARALLSPNMRGSLYMVFAMAAFTFNDALVKFLAQSLPIFEIIFIRGVLTIFILGAALIWSAGFLTLFKLNRPVIWWRALCEVGATYCFLTGLQFIELANAVAILSALPLALTLGGKFFLGESVGWRRWSAIAIGFIGVLLIIRPGFADFNIFSLNILATVLFATARDLITRQIPDNISTLSLAFSTAIAITSSGAVTTALFAAFEPVSVNQFALLIGTAFLLVFAYYFIAAAMRIGEVAFVAPFRYTNLLWALGLGWVLFDEKVDWLTLSGSFIIAATGIYTLYRERLKLKSDTSNTTTL